MTIINNHASLSPLIWCLHGWTQDTQEELGSYPALLKRKISKCLSISVIIQSPAFCKDASTLPQGAASFPAIKSFFPAKPRKSMDCHFLLQGIFPTRELNLHFLHWQGDSLPPSQLESLLWPQTAILLHLSLISLDRGAWQATVRVVTKSQTRLSD